MRSTYCNKLHPTLPHVADDAIGKREVRPSIRRYHLVIATSLISAFAGTCFAADPMPFALKDVPATNSNHTVVLGKTTLIWQPDDVPVGRTIDESDDCDPFTDNAVLSAVSKSQVNSSEFATQSLPSNPVAAEGVQFKTTTAGTIMPMLLADATPLSPSVGSSYIEPTKSDARPVVATTPNPSPANLIFSVKAGDRLSIVLTEFAKSNKLALQWNARTDFIIEHGYTISGATFQDTLREVLTPYGLSATVWEGNSVVEIYARNGEANER